MKNIVGSIGIIGFLQHLRFKWKQASVLCTLTRACLITLKSFIVIGSNHYKWVGYSHNFIGFPKKAFLINMQFDLMHNALSICICDRDRREKPTARYERGLVADSPGRRHRHNRKLMSYLANPNYI